MTTIRKRLASLLAVILCISLLAMPASAYTRVDTGKTASLELNYVDSERNFPIEGMTLRLYKVADMSETVRFTTTEDFAPASVFTDEFSWESLSTKDWYDLAGTLSAYTAANRSSATQENPAIVPAAALSVDAEGKVRFTEIPVGLYLVEGDSLDDGRYTYTPTPFLLTLPSLDTENDIWQYEVTAANKYSRSYDPGGGGDTTVSRNVIKVWEDEGSETDRPDSVTVQLLCNGKVYDTVTLNAANNWRHSWTRLNSSDTWQLMEIDVPGDYTVLVSQTGNTFVVTNTVTVDIPPEEPPTGPWPQFPVETPDVPGEDVDVPEEVDIFEEDVPLGNLPQTGTLWWPVQVLTIAGILFVSIGWLDNRRGKKKDET